MAWQDDYRISVVKYGANTIEGISQSSLDLNPTVRRTVAVRSTNAKVASLESVSPSGTFSSFNVWQAFQALGVVGICADEPGDDIELFCELRDCIGVQSNKTMKYTIAEGIIAPQTLSVDHRGDASMSYTINAKFDGTNSPVVIEYDQAEPTLTAGSDTKFTMDKMSIFQGGTPADTFVEGKIQITLDFGAQVNGRGADSNVADTVQTLDQTLQTLTVRGYDLKWYQEDGGTAAVKPVDVLTSGKLLEDTRYLRFWLKNRDEATASTEHIQITVRGVLVGETIFSGNPESPAECSFQMHLIEDSAANLPVIVNGALVAIP